MRIRGDALGLKADDFEPEQIVDRRAVPGQPRAPRAAARRSTSSTRTARVDRRRAPSLHANEFLTLKDENAVATALGRCDGPNKKVVPVKKLREGVWGIKPRNREQHFALDLLLNDDIKLVTLVGKAGTGKTLLAIAAGLQKVHRGAGVYQKLLVSRPIFPLGRDIGYLPGDIEEKLNPWMQPIYDNLELLLGLNKSRQEGGPQLRRAGRPRLSSRSSRSRTSAAARMPNQYMIVDEAQNLTPHEVKTIITRAGESTKIILTGDPYQIDNPYVDSSNNGLTTVVERFKDEAIAGHVILTKGERSPLAELAANML